MKTFGELTNDEKKKLMNAWVDGKEIESFTPGVTKHWSKSTNPFWFDCNSYRIKPEPKSVLFGELSKEDRCDIYDAYYQHAKEIEFSIPHPSRNCNWYSLPNPVWSPCYAYRIKGES